MQPDFKHSEEIRLVGLSDTMSLTENKTGDLWQKFLTQREYIPHVIGPELYDVKIYDENYFRDFRPDNTFEKWAAIQVSEVGQLPEGFSSLTIEAGQYAVFVHKGAAATAAKTFGYIFGEWLPKSGYHLDQRPHFDLLGEKYKNDSPDSEEEIWIPIK